MKTVGIDLWAGQVRMAAHNRGTQIVTGVRLPAFDTQRAFIHAYPRFAAACREVDEPGLALVAIDELTGVPAGLVCMRARVERHVTAVVGRHGCCDLYLEGRDALALRHLAVVVAPLRSWRKGSAEISYRVLDLRTEAGMLDETGRALRGLRAEGPSLLQCGGYVVLALPLGDPTDWPERAEDAWAMLPERVYFDELARLPEGSALNARVPRRAPGFTVITRTVGPRDTSAARLVENGEAAGRLAITGPGGQRVLTVGERALREGVLLGRYARCDGAVMGQADTLSRVHAMLLLADDRLLAIDTASTAGTRVSGGNDARVIELVGATTLELGGDTGVAWRWLP
ncbi:MAG: hypothetical protein IPQ07_09105 [Myxococcales bacterium]|nr:hypothetical protein [Myxococcales bacterium]